MYKRQLPVLLGRATKAGDILPVQDKRYRARFQLGVTTDTQDCTGTVLERREVRVSREELIAAIRSFEGEQMPLPPMYSALQVGGRRLYDIAREGGTVERTPRPVTFYSIEILDLGEDWAEIDVHCSKAVSYTHLEQVIQGYLAISAELLLLGLLLTLLYQFLGKALVLDCVEGIARGGNLGQTGDLHRHGRTGSRDAVAPVIEHHTHTCL